jgi:regulator of sigma E protease
MAAGLQTGDKITELNGTKIDRFQELQAIVSLHPNKKMTITYERGGKSYKKHVTPRLHESTDIFGNKVEIGLIGITPGGIIHTAKLTPGKAIVAAVKETYTICGHTLTALGQMITGSRSAKELSGIARIAEYSGQAASHGLETILWFMAILSINLGLINLFPVPMLDGGHLFLYAIEAVRGRPLGERALEYCFRFGLVVLISLMLFATFNDLKHFGVF